MPRKPEPPPPSLAVVSADGRREIVVVPAPGGGHLVVDLGGAGLTIEVLRMETPPGPRRRAGGVEPHR